MPSPAFDSPSLTAQVRPESQRPIKSQAPPQLSPSTLAQTVQQSQMPLTRPPLQFLGVGQRILEHGRHDRGATGVNATRKLQTNSNATFIVKISVES